MRSTGFILAMAMSLNCFNSVGAETKLKPTRPASANVWTTAVVVKPKPKPDRVRPRPRPKRVPLLTLEWRVVKHLGGGEQVETNPKTIFHTGDQVRVAMKTNQDGYLYVIRHNEGQDGEILFPDSR